MLMSSADSAPSLPGGLFTLAAALVVKVTNEHIIIAHYYETRLV